MPTLPCARRTACALGAALLLGAANPSPLPDQSPYAPIASMVDAVRADRLRSSVEHLVAFGTRNDFSEQTSTREHGVFGARDWIAGQFTDVAETRVGE